MLAAPVLLTSSSSLPDSGSALRKRRQSSTSSSVLASSTLLISAPCVRSHPSDGSELRERCVGALAPEADVLDCTNTNMSLDSMASSEVCMGDTSETESCTVASEEEPALAGSAKLPFLRSAVASSLSSSIENSFDDAVHRPVKQCEFGDAKCCPSLPRRIRQSLAQGVDQVVKHHRTEALCRQPCRRTFPPASSRRSIFLGAIHSAPAVEVAASQ